MKVMIYGDHVFSLEVAIGFLELGHYTEIINPITANELEQHICRSKPNIFMTLGTPMFYRQDMLKAIGKKPTPSTVYVHWDTDGVLWENREMSIVRLARPEMVFTICPIMQERIEKWGIPCYILPFASNPHMHHPTKDNGEYVGQITFVGNWYRALAETNPGHLRHKSMQALVSPLIKSNHDIHFYGANAAGYPFKEVFGLDIDQKYLHRHVPYEDIHKVYSGSFINLVPQNYEHSIIKRAFEILSSGGFGLSYDTAAMRETFPEGNGFVYTKSQEETLQLVEHYEAAPNDYNRIREKALIIARQHTYKQRAATIIGKILL